MLIAASAWTAQQVSGDVDRVTEAFPEGDRPAPVAGGGLTFLLVGLDGSQDASDGGAAALITVGHVTEDRQHLQFVSLPPDLAAGTDEASTATLADAFADGGPSGLMAAVETVSNVRIDHYADLDFTAFRTLTDEIGGLTVDVPAAVDARGGHHFDAGRQRLDGEQALAYMRAPQGNGEAALDRQQQVVGGLFEQVRRQANLSDPDDVTGLVRLMTGALRVDDTVDAALLTRLGLDLRNVGPPELLTVPLADAEDTDGPRRFDEDRAAAMWDYLSRDTLVVHMDEFS
jgi:LCP family protein required for cell wall assembly